MKTNRQSWWDLFYYLNFSLGVVQTCVIGLRKRSGIQHFLTGYVLRPENTLLTIGGRITVQLVTSFTYMLELNRLLQITRIYFLVRSNLIQLNWRPGGTLLEVVSYKKKLSANFSLPLFEALIRWWFTDLKSLPTPLPEIFVHLNKGIFWTRVVNSRLLKISNFDFLVFNGLVDSKTQKEHSE